MKKIITGIKPTGNGMHIGNYFGAFKPFLDLAKKSEAMIFIADYHSLTSVHSKETLEKNKKRMMREYFALLPENTKIIVFEQSKVKNINNMNWILSSQTPYSLMLRAHSFKDSQAKNSDINMATFNYPILMTADILSYDVDEVPVGKDQKQHLEFARDIAENFNKTYGKNFFKLPEPKIVEEMAVIPGIDGRKMSKSYDNHIGIFDDEKTLKKKIMSIVTGSEGLEEPKNPENCNVFALIRLFADSEKQEEIRQKYLAGGYGYGEAKRELLDLILKYFEIAREKFAKFENDDSFIKQKLEEGNEIANKIVDKKFEETMKIIGLKIMNSKENKNHFIEIFTISIPLFMSICFLSLNDSFIDTFKEYITITFWLTSIIVYITFIILTCKLYKDNGDKKSLFFLIIITIFSIFLNSFIYTKLYDKYIYCKENYQVTQYKKLYKLEKNKDIEENFVKIEKIRDFKNYCSNINFNNDIKNL